MAIGGLILKKPDIRQRSHAVNFGAAKSYPTRGLGRKPLAVYDQQDTQFCTALSMAGTESFKRGVPISPEFMVAVEGEVNTEPIFNGTTMDTAPKALVVFGAIPQKDCPYSLRNDGAQKIAYWANYPAELWAKAKQYTRGGYYTAHDGPYDAYDNIISAIYKAHQQGEEIAVQCGTAWYDEFSQAAMTNKPLPIPTNPQVSEHAWVIFDWVGDTAYALLSEGETWGNNGVLKVPRATVNFLFQNPNATTRVMRDKDQSTTGLLLSYLYSALYQLQQLLK